MGQFYLKVTKLMKAREVRAEVQFFQTFWSKVRVCFRAEPLFWQVGVQSLPKLNSVAETQLLPCFAQK